ncbi:MULTISPECIES: glycine cleavage system aminomethyltransferase GcvT [unclassified Undibacterium]|uniref:glycine cleavage system aminomethyltransferase GcvT n=1 Tax=unclassified Undibacterium TaxID=2630295 RepID=UPI002AC8D7B2|nr:MULTISPECIES: glycine cleavage system aminomethyltransferase GcvT [unclassified Undibacterium]MEB0137763.1 glycine cleavage system aminomethyltransferase GcvT [Undibacterium sp. CCC2.1]MEB0174025.1 glycine cleavage system aminomethyltransferase GcvT [Undibacterium sp. CCC1.1]MEB0177981.1 glycine cleavage system aminomethyltransferase GcvT [Undibacterium sp. CCC3.4]MEB0217216.1 glycine cleavage system aminomethyltransferase GcvT [Undibacterium sp. 5I2]WPX42338.1 glycine cleavage system amino
MTQAATTAAATPLNTTPLNGAHRAAGAKMVDFGGWDMPVNYGSQIEEHHAVRGDCGMFDVSHMCVVDLRGPQVRAFLRGLVANNVDKLQVPGKALYSCMLTPAGTVVDDLIIYFFDETWFRLVVNAGTAAKDVAWMQAHNDATAAGISITARRDGADAFALIAVQGPNARAKVWQILPQTQAASVDLKPFNAVIVAATAYGEVMVARTGYTGEDGFEIAVAASRVTELWNALAAIGVAPAGLGARDTLRLEAGMNLYGQDMDESVNPLNAGLAWTIDLLSERDFVGKQALLEQGQSAQFLGLLLREKGGILRAHQKVLCAQGEGEITSGTFSPSMQQAIALARLPLGVAIGDTVHVVIRDKQLAATVVKLPFVRNGKVLVA